MPVVDLGDVSIHYQEAGSGPLALVFCPGVDTERGREFAANFEAWRQHFDRVLTWDPRGLGGSSTTRKYSLPLYASDLARLMDRLDVQRAVVMGMLWGGILTQQFALDYPERCAGLVLDSTTSEVNVQASERWYQMAENAKQDTKVNQESRESLVAAYRSVAGLREHPLTPRLKGITCPVLVVAGVQVGFNKRDEVASAIMANSLPNATLRLLEGVGAGIIRQRPDQFRQMVVDFCRSQGVINR